MENSIVENNININEVNNTYRSRNKSINKIENDNKFKSYYSTKAIVEKIKKRTIPNPHKHS